MTYYRDIVKWAVIYLGLLLFFFVFVQGNVVVPPKGNIYFQVYTTIAIAVMAYGILKYPISHGLQISMLLFFQIIATIALWMYSEMQWGTYVSANPDAIVYDSIASNFVNSGKSWRDFSLFVSDRFYVDDMGYTYLIAFIYSLVGSDLGPEVLALLNCIVVVFSAHLLYRIALVLNFSRASADFVCFLWGVMPFSIFTSCAGMKENFMLCCLIASFYFLCKLNKNFSIRNVILFLLLASTQLAFRTALFFMLLLSAVLAIVIRWPIVYKHIHFWLALVGLIALLSFSVFVEYSFALRGSEGDTERLVEMMDAKAELGGGVIAELTNIVAVLIGPFTNFITNSQYKADYITIFGFGTMIKMMLSFGYLYGMYRIFKDKEWRLMPIAVFIILHSIMLIVTFYALHDRFQWPQMPFVFLIAIYGINRLRISRLNVLQISRIYPLVVIGLIVFYNLRIV